MKILMVDKDLHFSNRLGKRLSSMGHRSDRFECCERAGKNALQGDYDLLIVNVENTGDQASNFLQGFSKASNTPVIVISSNAEIETKIHHLRMGAVDYVVKPVDFEELLARVDLQLRKTIARSAVTSKLVFDELTIHLSHSSVERGGKSIGLTQQEFATLLYLARHHGKPVSRQKLFENIWGGKSLHQSNLINVAMRRLRAKVDDPFEKKFLHTVHGVGYAAGFRN